MLRCNRSILNPLCNESGGGGGFDPIAARIQNAISRIPGRGYEIYSFEFGYNRYGSFGLTIDFSSDGTNESGVTLGTIWEHIPELDDDKTDYALIEQLSFGASGFGLTLDRKKELIKLAIQASEENAGITKYFSIVKGAAGIVNWAGVGFSLFKGIQLWREKTSVKDKLLGTLNLSVDVSIGLWGIFASTSGLPASAVYFFGQAVGFDRQFEKDVTTLARESFIQNSALIWRNIAHLVYKN